MLHLPAMNRYTNENQRIRMAIGFRYWLTELTRCEIDVKRVVSRTRRKHNIKRALLFNC